MKASELVKLLQEKIAESGDLEIRIPADSDTYIDDEELAASTIAGIATCVDEHDKAIEFMIMDENWADALSADVEEGEDSNSNEGGGGWEDVGEPGPEQH